MLESMNPLLSDCELSEDPAHWDALCVKTREEYVRRIKRNSEKLIADLTDIVEDCPKVIFGEFINWQGCCPLMHIYMHRYGSPMRISICDERGFKEVLWSLDRQEFFYSLLSMIGLPEEFLSDSIRMYDDECMKQYPGFSVGIADGDIAAQIFCDAIRRRLEIFLREEKISAENA